MSEYGRLRGFWEDFNSYLDVNIEVDHVNNQQDNPVLVKFTVTNIGQAQEDRPEIVFEEVVLKVNVPPDTFEKKTENLSSAQSFSYELRCAYDSIMQMQWSIEGRISPLSLLQFRRKPESIQSNGQFPLETYFGFLDQIKIHQWLEGPLKSISTPGPDTTLGEMKQKEEYLHNIDDEIKNSIEKFQNFLNFVDYKQKREDILQHRKSIVEYLQLTRKKINELKQQLQDNKIEVFTRSREIAIDELTVKLNNLNEATTNLAEKLGVIEPALEKLDEDSNLIKTEIPPPIALREIDLHGHTVEQALPVVDNFLNECFMENVRRVRIIHGKGIFILQRGIREYLNNHKLIITESISSAHKDHGGEGATEANLVEFVPTNNKQSNVEEYNDTDEDW